MSSRPSETAPATPTHSTPANDQHAVGQRKPDDPVKNVHTSWPFFLQKHTVKQPSLTNPKRSEGPLSHSLAST